MNSNFQTIIIVVVNVVVTQITNDIKTKIRQKLQQIQQNNDQFNQSKFFKFFDFSNSFDENFNSDENFLWRSKNLNFFDFKLFVFYDSNFMIRNDKNVYYRNVHLFCKKIRNLIVIKNEKLIRINLNICFFYYAFIWYISKLKVLNEIDLRNFSFEND